MGVEQPPRDSRITDSTPAWGGNAGGRSDIRWARRQLLRPCSYSSSGSIPRRIIAKSLQQELCASLLGAAGKEAARAVQLAYQSTSSNLGKVQRLVTPPPPGEHLKFLCQSHSAQPSHRSCLPPMPALQPASPPSPWQAPPAFSSRHLANSPEAHAPGPSAAPPPARHPPATADSTPT